uniref:Alanine--tRNA ligase n=1 Tax=Zeugodacus cucurbitae TaxID=28588 RepID=A0A0A1XMB1_ZEUCU
MLKKNLLLAIGLLLLIQLTTCLPKPTSSESEEDNIIPHGTSTAMSSVSESAVPNGRKRLEANVFKGHINFLNFCLRRSNQIAKNVLADPSMNRIESQAMEYERNTLTKYVKDSKQALAMVLPADKNGRNDRFFFAMGKDFVLEDFNGFYRRRASTFEVLTPEQQVSWEALKKHGALEYNAEMKKRSKEFASHIVDEFDNYMKTLPAAEREKEKELYEVWDKYTKNKLEFDKVELGEKLFLELFQYESDK